MTNNELQEYLKGFDGERTVAILIADPKKRVRYKIENAFALTDFDAPVFCLELGREIAFDAEETALAEECEREVIEDESKICNG